MVKRGLAAWASISEDCVEDSGLSMRNDEGDSDGLSSNNGETSKIEVFRASSKDGKSKATEHGLFAAKCPKRDITQRVKPILLAFITEIKGISGSAMASNIPFWCGHKRKGPGTGELRSLKKIFRSLQSQMDKRSGGLRAKSFDIPKREVWEAYKRVKANQGAAGVDGESIESFEADGIAR